MANKDQGKPAETGPETAQSVPATPNVDTTVAAPQPVASGPSFQLQHEGQDLANIRVETVHCGGEACGMSKLEKKDISGEQGNVCIVATATPVFGGADLLAQAVGTRGRMPLVLSPNDDKNSELKGDFVVSRMSPAGLVNGEATYNLVLENAGPAPKEEKAEESEEA